MSPLVVVFAWALWHDLSVYRAAELLPLAGPTYQGHLVRHERRV